VNQGTWWWQSRAVLAANAKPELSSPQTQPFSDAGPIPPGSVRFFRDTQAPALRICGASARPGASPRLGRSRGTGREPWRRKLRLPPVLPSVKAGALGGFPSAYVEMSRREVFSQQASGVSRPFLGAPRLCAARPRSQTRRESKPEPCESLAGPGPASPCRCLVPGCPGPFSAACSSWGSAVLWQPDFLLRREENRAGSPRFWQRARRGAAAGRALPSGAKRRVTVAFRESQTVLNAAACPLGSSALSQSVSLFFFILHAKYLALSLSARPPEGFLGPRCRGKAKGARPVPQQQEEAVRKARGQISAGECKAGDCSATAAHACRLPPPPRAPSTRRRTRCPKSRGSTKIISGPKPR